MERREVHHRAGVENPAEVRQPAFGGGAGDQIERPGVDRDDRDLRGALRWRHVERPRRAAAPRAADRRPRPRSSQRRRHRDSGDDDEARGPQDALRSGRCSAGPAPPARTAAPTRPGRVAPRVIVRHVSGGEHERERPQVRPHQRRAGGGRDRAEPRQHADADPRRRKQLARQQLAHDEQRRRRSPSGARRRRGRRSRERHEPARVERQTRIQLQKKRSGRSRSPAIAATSELLSIRR